MLRLVGAVAVGTAAAAIGSRADPVSASTGDTMTAGNTASATSGDLTQLNGNFRAIADSSNGGSAMTGHGATIVGYSYANSSTSIEAGVLGMGGNFVFPFATTAHGVVGKMFNALGSGSGVYGVSNANAAGTSAGVRARSEKGPAVQLEVTFPDVPTSGTWTAGALVPDSAGRLWYCTVGGSPGTWRNLTAPTFHPITPTRVYDSRSPLPSQGTIAAGGTRTLSVKDGRDLTTGAVTVAGLVPAGAVAITCNVTVVNTVGAGFLAVNPGGVSAISAATVNWSASGQILNNGVNVTIDPATLTVTVVAGGGSGASTDFIIDVTGFYL